MKELVLNNIKKLHIEYSSSFAQWLNIVDDNIVDAINYSLNYYRKFDGIQEHIKIITQIKDLSNDSERKIRNRVAELIACRFIENVLKYRIIQVESSNVPILSPFRTKEKKSCDILAVSQCKTHYFEVKDSSTEIMSEKDYGNHIFYTPATRPYLEEWLYWKIKESIEKGATELFTIVPLWINPCTDNINDFWDTWIRKIFTNRFQIIDSIDINHYLVQADFEIPSYFRQLVIPNREKYLNIILVSK